MIIRLLCVLICCAAGLAALEAAMPEPDWANLTDAQWKARLTPEQYDVLRRKGTEPAFCGGYGTFKKTGAGEHRCSGCGWPLFVSTTSFDSGSGWPSFFRPIDGQVALLPDRSHGMDRVEVACGRCGGHLGHVFEDGPPPTGLRYCINAICLRFVPQAEIADRPAGRRIATFGGGCFWGVEALFRATPGVVDARVGYAGGKTANPTYREVCSDETGHAEVCEVTYDPAKITFGELLVVFFENHDPTTLNRQGPDVGSQYRSVVFTHDAAQAALARAFIAALNQAKAFRKPVVTTVEPAPTFWKAEDYHQNYAATHPHGGACHFPQGIKLAGRLAPAVIAAGLADPGKP